MSEGNAITVNVVASTDFSTPFSVDISQDGSGGELGYMCSLANTIPGGHNTHHAYILLQWSHAVPQVSVPVFVGFV